MVSIVIPARNEIFLTKTINDILSNAVGEIEVIPVLDGYWPSAEEIVHDPRVRYVHIGEAKGMRNAINTGVSLASGEYIMKLDAHCKVGYAFDKILAADCEDNWIVIPRRYRLDAEKWEVQQLGKLPVDYEFLCHPGIDQHKVGLHGNIWNERTLKRIDTLIDDNMSFQGSCWFMTRKHWDWLGGMSEEGYGQFVREAQEIGLKTWLGGGRVVTNKKTWYAHLHKGKQYGRMWFLDKYEADAGNQYCDDYWMNNRWEGRIHDLEWLIEKFAPVPTWNI